MIVGGEEELYCDTCRKWHVPSWHGKLKPGHPQYEFSKAYGKMPPLPNKKPKS